MNKTLIWIATLLSIASGTGRAYAQSNGRGGCAIADPPHGVITIEEFADFECSYCARGANVLKRVLKEYPGKIRLVYRNMPLAAHANALVAARAFSAVCLQSPAFADAFQRRLFANQAEFRSKGEPYLYEIAVRIGVNLGRMRADMGGADVARELAEDQLAAIRHSFTGTPSFVIGNETVVGAVPYSEIKKVIDRQLGN